MLYFWKRDKSIESRIELKKNQYILFYLMILLLFLGCTRDDICSETTQTTPMLIITFKDAINPLQASPVSNLTVKTTDDPTIPIYKSVTTDSIAVPLRADFDITQLLFIAGDTEESEGNTDFVVFNYNPENVYVNRACSYKMIYRSIDIMVLPENDNTNWIQNTEIVSTHVENENQAHINIFH